MDTDITPLETVASTESAHTSSRKSAPTLRMDLIPRGERHRRWTTDQKQTIAAQSLAPGASPTNVARLHGVSTGQLYMWRQSAVSTDQPPLPENPALLQHLLLEAQNKRSADATSFAMSTLS